MCNMPSSCPHYDVSEHTMNRYDVPCRNRRVAVLVGLKHVITGDTLVSAVYLVMTCHI